MKPFGLVPAAGIGKRLRPITDKIPKPLVEVGGKPLIQITIESLRKIGISEVVVVLGYKKTIIKDFLDCHDFGVNIRYSYPNKLLGLAYSVLSAREHINRTFAMHLPDNIFTNNYGYVLKTHKKENAVATLLVEKGEPEGRYETILLEGNRIKKIIEKAGISYGYRGTGLYIFEPEFFDYCEKVEKSERGEHEIQDGIRRLIEDNKKVIGVKINGQRFEITTEEDINVVENLKL